MPLTFHITQNHGKSANTVIHEYVILSDVGCLQQVGDDIHIYTYIFIYI
jgi:hypothetical protein